VPGTFAAEDELFGIGRVLGELGTGVFELAPAGVLGEDLAAPAKEIDWMRRLAGEIRRPVSFALNQNNAAPDAWRDLLDQASAAGREGAPVRPQVHGRTVSILVGFRTFHPFAFAPTWGSAGLGLLPWAEQVARLTADAELRTAIVGEARAMERDPIIRGFMNPDRVYVLGDPPDYEPPPEASVTGTAAVRGAGVWETFLDLLLADGGRALLNSPVLNYSNGNLDAAREMLVHPTSVFGLGDGGAHASQTCDASTTTYMLSYWARDRARGRIPIEEAVRLLTSATADLYGLGDRGRLVPGLKGDANVIDFAGLRLHAPDLVADLPAGASRFTQHVDGYVATINAGAVTVCGGDDTGARPGRLLRGAR
jgi:N-acyl-D-aspartate/D-glutamate deacylase